MTFSDLSPVANHLWQSTIFVVAAWVLTLALRKNRASVRYWVWFAASVKFLIPFSLLVAVGSKFAWQSSPVITQPQFASVINGMSQPFAIVANTSTAAALPHTSSALSLSLLAVWICGVVVGLIFWLRSVWQIRAIRRAATALPLSLSIPVMSSSARMEPGVFGMFNPVLILPEGITDRLTPTQLRAVFAHELCHVRRRDNLTATSHMVVETIFWFHPLVWWIRTRLVAERECACDEVVVAGADDPQVYAEAILNVCKHYIESPLPCVSGVTGSDLKKRIGSIMSGRVGGKLSSARKAALIILATATIAAPFALGLTRVMTGRAIPQAQSAGAVAGVFEYDVASFKLNKSGPGRATMTNEEDGLTATNFSVKDLIAWAYGFRSGALDGRIFGAPSWLESESYDVQAKMDTSVAEALKKLSANERNVARQHMLQKLLADRCKLETHRETRELAVFSLVIAKDGSKLKESKAPDANAASGAIGAPGRGGRGLGLKGSGGPLTAREIGMADLVDLLALLLNRPVLDKTGLTGKYDFTLAWTPDESQDPNFFPAGAGQPPDPSGPSLFTAIQQQLGLKLESGKGPVQVIVIDRVERPSGN